MKTAYFLYQKLQALRPDLLKLFRTVIGLSVEANIVKLCANLSVCLSSLDLANVYWALQPGDEGRTLIIIIVSAL